MKFKLANIIYDAIVAQAGEVSLENIVLYKDNNLAVIADDNCYEIRITKKNSRLLKERR